MTSFRTRIACVMTSGPMPSPGMTAIRNGIASAYREAQGRKFWGLSSIPLHSADGRDRAERGAGQDAPPPPRPALIAPHLLGHLGIRRAGLPRPARRRHRRPGVGLSAPTLPSARGGGSLCWILRGLDQTLQHLAGAPAVQRVSGDLHGLGPIVGSAGGQYRCGRIEQNDIAARPTLTVEYLTQQGRVLRRRPAFQLAGAGPRKTKVFGVQLKVIDLAVAQLEDS